MLAGCQTLPPAGGYAELGSAIQSPEWHYHLLSANDFSVPALISTGDGPLTVYIEGDGRAWLGRHRVAPDPTPDKPVALWLAQGDDGHRAWLARPCQYPAVSERQRQCQPRFWTSHRYGSEMLQTMDNAIEQLKALSGADRLELVGYSGGGALAILLAARRDDVTSVRTVAGNLDQQTFSRHHGVAPLRQSLNALEHAADTARIPQIHFSGNQDNVVPAAIIESFINALPEGHCARHIRVDADHLHGWREQWPSLLAKPPLSGC